MVMSFADVVPVALFPDGPWRWRVATRSTTDAAWLQIDPEDLPADVEEKARVFAQHPEDSLVSLPGSEGPCDEVFELVAQYLVDAGCSPLPDGPEPPLQRAALAIHEDLVVMQRRGDEWVMTAGAVCFPTGWSPAEYLGRSLAQIHSVVPRFDEIAVAVNRLFDRIRPGSVVWRPNWSVLATSELRLPAGRPRQTPATATVDDLYLRIERQTLRRLVAHPDAMVFTIRIHRWPLAEVVSAIDQGLLEALCTMPDDVADYKNLRVWREVLVRHLGPSFETGD